MVTIDYTGQTNFPIDHIIVIYPPLSYLSPLLPSLMSSLLLSLDICVAHSLCILLVHSIHVCLLSLVYIQDECSSNVVKICWF